MNYAVECAAKRKRGEDSARGTAIRLYMKGHDDHFVKSAVADKLKSEKQLSSMLCAARKIAAEEMEMG